MLLIDVTDRADGHVPLRHERLDLLQMIRALFARADDPEDDPVVGASYIGGRRLILP
jgi:hypothetical protein